MFSLFGSAFTLQATSSWAVDEATCFADVTSFSSLASPWTAWLAASHKFPVERATSWAAEIKPCDHWPSSLRVAPIEPTCDYDKLERQSIISDLLEIRRANFWLAYMKSMALRHKHWKKTITQSLRWKEYWNWKKRVFNLVSTYYTEQILERK